MNKRNPVKRKMDKENKPKTHKDKTRYSRKKESRWEAFKGWLSYKCFLSLTVYIQ